MNIYTNFAKKKEYLLVKKNFFCCDLKDEKEKKWDIQWFSHYLIKKRLFFFLQIMKSKLLYNEGF